MQKRGKKTQQRNLRIYIDKSYKWCTIISETIVTFGNKFHFWSRSSQSQTCPFRGGTKENANMTSIELRIRNIYDSLSNAERRVADYFLNNMENVFNLPIAVLAQEAGVSKVTWVRFKLR